MIATLNTNVASKPTKILHLPLYEFTYSISSLVYPCSIKSLDMATIFDGLILNFWEISSVSCTRSCEQLSVDASSAATDPSCRNSSD